jgi:superfamily II DNA or RNA helicase
MSLTSYLNRQVSADVQNRGRQYYRRGAVRNLDGNGEFVSATVQGTQPYDVFVERDGSTLIAACTCPYVTDYGGPCKHIWAAILAAKDRGFLSAGRGEPRYLELAEPEPDDSSFQEDWEVDDNYEDEIEPFAVDERPARPTTARPTRPRRKRQPASWKKVLSALQKAEQPDGMYHRQTWPAGRELLYIVDIAASKPDQGLVLEVAYRQRKLDGDWSVPKIQRIPRAEIPRLADSDDRQIFALLGGAHEHYTTTYNYYGSYNSDYDTAPSRYQLTSPLQETLLPILCRTGRCFYRRSEAEPDLQPLSWEDGPTWEFWLTVVPAPSGKQYQIRGELRRGPERLPLAAPVLLIGGLVFWPDRAARLDDGTASDWFPVLRRDDKVSVPAGQKDDLIRELVRLPRLPRLDLPDELRFEEVIRTPRPRLKVRAPTRRPSWGYQSDRLQGELSFDYDGQIIAANNPGWGVYQPDHRRLILRDQAAESAAAGQLQQLGFKSAGSYYDRPAHLVLTPRHLPRAVSALLQAGWHVEADGKLYRRPGEIRIDVTSGIDWFDLNGTVQFGDTVAHLPELLAALQRGENTVKLGDGTFGMLPEEWLKKYGVLAGLGTAEGDHLRFGRSQVGLLDALLASQPEATCDAAFRKLRDQLRTFEGVQPADAPEGFTGQLRGYQREGLGWLYFLQKFGFGGCLADDMGLGKTVQVLALLESRRALRARHAGSANGTGKRPAPSLVVVPRSLVFNWIQEATRFSPQLHVLDHTGALRSKTPGHFDDHDVILTTYGTLRRDALLFKNVTFDYCILDESQAIKNAKTDSAKAVRLLRADYRLALSGTPIENHLGELWSLFEFLNPGMFGRASVFAGGLRNPSEETRSLLARGLRPFILRRTKDQVARDLPKKLEQTLYCELEANQRKQYDDLRQHYRQSLLARVEREGVNRSKIQILEALLRLRQAACHPGLIDTSKTAESSAKLDLLLPQLVEVTEEGHKAIVFSQFTSLLAIARARLDKDKIPYEYLDGRTRDRQARVERFQNDPDCKLFLVSLKAGGLGLNLTAAEYVFLLDPWWNPAVEAQAIDRAHRIGQTRAVFAYRLIARDTVEEKVLELQMTKRDLADAIINADNSLIRNLDRADLELLLS